MNLFLILFFFSNANQICGKLTSFQSIYLYLEKNDAENIFNKIIDEGIIDLRGPIEDGNFKYAQLSKENPVALNFSFDLEKFPFVWAKSAENIFSIKIYVPKKKNIFWGNEDAYLKELLVKLDGIEKIIKKDQILKRGETYEYPLNKIFKKFEISLTFEKMEEKVRSSYVEVNLYQAGLVDDPKNPDYKLLQSLIELKKIGIDSNYFKESLDKTLTNCPNSLKRELYYILYLLKGNPEEQMEGIEKLEKLLNNIN